MDNLSDNVITIVGPTASGKSDIANELAYKINGEVISADSMQIYKGMDIGTGKILPNEQKVKHWGLNIVRPDQPYSVALFQKYARNCIKDIWSRNKSAILCGGTGFYIKATIDDYNFAKGEQVNNKVRDYYNNFYKENGADALWGVLNSKDPNSAKLIHKNNVIRVIRALELYEQGISYSDQISKLNNIKPFYGSIMFGLKVDVDKLNLRIKNRVNNMIENGFVEEVKELINQGYLDALTSSNAIGYKEIAKYLNGQINIDKAINNIIIATRQYAKRQRTWFNKDKRIIWINYNKIDIENAVDEIISSCDKVL